MRLTLFLLFSLTASFVFGQTKHEKKANELFQRENFAAAIPLYLKVLNEKSNNGIKSKLARCYRFINQLDSAERYYVEIVDSERVRPNHIFDYGEVLMGLGRYEAAKEIFEKYKTAKPEDERGQEMIIACDNIKNIQRKYKNIHVEEFPQNSTADDNSPVFFDEGIVFSSDRKRGTNIFKDKSGTTGREFLYLYESKKEVGEGYGEATLFSRKINVLNKNLGSATFSQDKNTVIFSRNADVVSKNDSYNIQLFEATWDEDKWADVKVLEFCSKEYNFMHPSLSPDGQTLYFASDIGRGFGGTDIYVSKKNGEGWSKPENLGGTINTKENEGFPFIDADGNLYFCSKGHFGLGGFDIFKSQNKQSIWQAPANLGEPINSSYDDISITFSSDGKRGAFTSSRGANDDNIYLFELNDAIVRSNTKAQVDPQQ